MDLKRWRGRLDRFRAILKREIWHDPSGNIETPKEAFYALLRIAIISGNGLVRNNIAIQAAALSYYTLIALGPLLAIGIMISGFLVQEDDTEGAVAALTQIIYFVAPPAEEVENVEIGEPSEGEVAFHLRSVLNTLVTRARSGALGAVGTLMLVFISIQLLATIESTFNRIWGVRRNRSLRQQVQFYWGLITTGSILGTLIVTFGTVGKLTEIAHTLPLGEFVAEQVIWVAPLLSVVAVVVLLTLFYQAIPNTSVRITPAVLGALLVTILLQLNQQLSFFYIGGVIRQQSLLGVVGILPVLLFGLYVFWLFLLLGGQLTFAIQNVNSLTNQRAWEGMSHRTREALSLAALVLICRRFAECGKPFTAVDLSERIRVPGNLINQVLVGLCDLGLVVAVLGVGEEGGSVTRFQPGLPLSKLCISEVLEQFSTAGNNEGVRLIRGIDPIVQRYEDRIQALRDNPDLNLSLEELLQAETH